jgi:hypothetical protein
VKVRPDDSSGDDAFGAITVAFSDLDATECLRLDTRNCPSGVVLKPSQDSDLERVAIGSEDGHVAGEEFPDRSRLVNADRVAIQEAETGLVVAVRVGKTMAEDLHASADSKDSCACVDSSVQRATRRKFCCSLDLGSIFAAANEIQIA